MRIGQNPLRGQEAESMPEIIGCVITHLPDQVGYHKHRFEIIRLCLNSMRQNANRDLLIYVWDNASCWELRDWLIREYRPEFLTFSPNIGKASARSSLIRAFPTKTIVCISDDDIYYYPNWLQPQLDLLNGFPNVGQVSGYPVRTQFRWGTKSTFEWAKKNAKITIGKLIPPEWDLDWCKSIGRDYAWQLKYTEKDQDILIEYQELQAYATSHHCQFITIAGRLEYIVQWDGEAISDEKRFDSAIDQEGYLRLTTTQRLVRHIGNVIEPELRQELCEKSSLLLA